ELLNSPPRKPVKIVKQQQNSDADNQKRTNRLSFAEIFQWIVQPLSRKPGLCRAVRINRHVNPKPGDADPQCRFRSAAYRTVHADDEEEQKNRQVNDALAILLVVKRAKPRQKPKKKRQYRTRPQSCSR